MRISKNKYHLLVTKLRMIQKEYCGKCRETSYKLSCFIALSYFAGMSIYMAFFVLLLLFEGNMPPASEGVPILGELMCSYVF